MWESRFRALSGDSHALERGNEVRNDQKKGMRKIQLGQRRGARLLWARRCFRRAEEDAPGLVVLVRVRGG